MAFTHCEHRGIDADTVMRRLRLVGLVGRDNIMLGYVLQRDVIAPNVDPIIGGFLDSLLELDQFRSVIDKHTTPERLQKTLTGYLLSLGVDYERLDYFEERLRVGAAHNHIGVPQRVYHSAIRKLQSLLIRHIPKEIRDDDDRFDTLLEFILKITSLDLSLAAESYGHHRVMDLEESLRDERGEAQRLRRMAITDWLTDLHNHAYSRELLAEALEKAQQGGSPLCVIMADLDQFKRVNDTHGHLVGDHVLRIAAARMVSGARVGDEIARYGGEEFLFVLRNTSLDEAAEVAERVRLRINGDEIHHKRASIRVSLSLGIAEARSEDTVDTLIERADAALYAAKVAGRDRVFLEAAL